MAKSRSLELKGLSRSAALELPAGDLKLVETAGLARVALDARVHEEQVSLVSADVSTVFISDGMTADGAVNMARRFANEASQASQGTSPAIQDALARVAATSGGDGNLTELLRLIREYIKFEEFALRIGGNIVTSRSNEKAVLIIVLKALIEEIEGNANYSYEDALGDYLANRVRFSALYSGALKQEPFASTRWNEMSLLDRVTIAAKVSAAFHDEAQNTLLRTISEQDLLAEYRGHAKHDENVFHSLAHDLTQLRNALAADMPTD